LASGLSQFPNYTQVWLNDGSGNFIAGAQLPAQLGNAEGFALADLNGDGFDDAIVVSRGSIAIYLNNGTGDGSFGSPTAYYYNDLNYFPLGNFQSIRVAAGKTSTGKVNLAITGAGAVSWGLLYSVNSNGTLAPNPQILATGAAYPTAEIEFVDVNKNGLPALVIKGLYGSPVAVFGNDGSGNFGNSVSNGSFTYKTPTFSLPATDQNESQNGVQFIDMDHDGVLDMVVLTLGANSTNTVFWYKGLGNTLFETTSHTAWSAAAPAQIYSGGQFLPGSTYITSCAADIDGDGNADLVLANQLTQPVILKNNGNGTFSLAWASALADSNGHPAFAHFMSYVDLTGTGQQSLIGSNNTNNSSQFYTPYGEFYGAPRSTVRPPVVASDSQSLRYDLPFSYTITATNSPTTYGITLPSALSGLSVNASTGVISGSLPAAVGTYTIGLSAKNAGGTGLGTLTLSVIDKVPPVIAPPTVAVVKPKGEDKGGDWLNLLVTAVAKDALDPAPTTLITSVTYVDTLKPKKSGEKDDGKGDGKTKLAAPFSITGPLTLKIRGELEDGTISRVYTITITSTDNSKNASTATVIYTQTKRSEDSSRSGKDS
jgi:hypothetical protein